MIIRTHMLDPDNYLGDIKHETHQYSRAQRIDQFSICIDSIIYTEERSGGYFNTKEIYSGSRPCHPIDVVWVSDMLVYPTYVTISSAIRLCNIIPHERSYEKLWGFEKITVETMDYLAKKMQNPFIASGDGGCPAFRSYGTYGYIFATTKGKAFYRNQNVSPLHYSQRAPMRFEGLCMLAIITLINAVEKYAEEKNILLSTKRKYILDNSQIANLDRSRIYQKKFFKIPHSDVVNSLILEWNKSPNHPKSFTKVKGHQDDKKKWKDLTINERLNVYADRACHTADRIERKRKTLQTTIAPKLTMVHLSIRNKHRRFISEKPTELHIDRANRKLSRYIRNRDYLPRETFEMICWPAIKLVNSKENISKQSIVMKVVHQKWITTYQQFKQKTHPTGLCPLCKREIETQPHVFLCDNIELQESRTLINKAFHSRLLGIHTPKPLADALLHILLDDWEIPRYTERFLVLPKDQQDEAMLALGEQIDIGFSNLQRAMFSRTWSKAVSLHARFYDIKKFYVESWEKQFAWALIERSQNIWRARCRLNEKKEDTYLHQVRRIATKDLLYLKRNREVIGKYKSLIRYNNRYFLTASRRTIQMWNSTRIKALKETREALERKQTLITKYGTYTRTVPSERKKQRPFIPPRPKVPRDVFLSQFMKLPTYYRRVFSDRPPPEPDPNV